MEFKVGEKVRFLHENMEGIIQEILSPKMVLVLVDDVLEEEVNVEELVKIHRAERVLRFDEPEKPEPEAVSETAKRTPLAAALVRVDSGEYEIWLINPAPLEVFFTLFGRIRKRIQPINSGQLSSRSERLLGKLSTDEFHHCRSLIFQILKYSAHPEFNPIPPLVIEIPIRTEVFKQKPETIAELGKEGYYLPLEELEPEKSPEQAAAKTVEKPAAPPSEVVDLHIQKLMDYHHKMDGDSLLKIQIEAFQQALNQAVLHKMPRIIFIHGIGSGRLRDSIETILDGHQFVFGHKRADILKYGNGAIEVELA
ncbi:MAG: DUF2027 domain-containing protein [Bacteroidia bacterium]|nr:DUF2027 domain-containing protein [Bacteroidia bacterium]